MSQTEFQLKGKLNAQRKIECSMGQLFIYVIEKLILAIHVCSIEMKYVNFPSIS